MAVIAIPISLQSMITIGVNMTDTVMVGMQDITSLKKTITLMLRLCIVLAVLFMLPTILCYFLQGMTMTCTIVLRSVGQVNFR